MRTDAQKRACIKWRENHREVYNARNLVYNLKYGAKNKTTINAYAKAKYHYDRDNSYEVIAKIFLKILR